VSDVAAVDGNRVPQSATNEYAIHQFKDFTTANSINLICNCRTSIPCSQSTLYLEIFNVLSEEWEVKDSDTTTGAGVDIELTASINDLTNYKQDNIITCRVYQKAQ